MKIFEYTLSAILLFTSISCNTIKTLVSPAELERLNYQEVEGLFNSDNSNLPQPDVFPMYPNGLNGLMTDVNRLVQYPNEERLNNIEGLVVVKYVIEKDGSVSNIELEKEASAGLNAEAIRVIKNLRNWYPGLKAGQPVRVEFKQPFDFKLN
ncbi:MAG: energy transducer TonB [Bacteroidota bacterium]